MSIWFWRRNQSSNWKRPEAQRLKKTRQLGQMFSSNAMAYNASWVLTRRLIINIIMHLRVICLKKYEENTRICGKTILGFSKTYLHTVRDFSGKNNTVIMAQQVNNNGRTTISDDWRDKVCIAKRTQDIPKIAHWRCCENGEKVWNKCIISKWDYFAGVK